MDTNKSNFSKRRYCWCVTLAESGLSICQSYDFIVNEKFNKEDYNLYLIHMQAIHVLFFVYAQHKHMSSATRALIDFLCSNDD